jgi:hypothetical protein
MTENRRTTSLANLQQGHSESVDLFHCRIIKAVDDLQTLASPVGTSVPSNLLSLKKNSAFAASPDSDGFDGAAAPVDCTTAAAFSHVALHLFISNLRPLLRQEVSKSPPTSLNDAFQKAKELEHILAQDDKQKNYGSAAMPKKVRTYL